MGTKMTASTQGWETFWHLMLAGDPPQMPQQKSLQVTLDAEFDFLAEQPEQAPEPQPGKLGKLLPDRLRDVAQLDAFMPHILEKEALLLLDDPRLDGVDAAGTLWLCRALLDVRGLQVTEHGALVRLLQRAVRAEEAELVMAAADAIGHLDARAAQLDAVARLHANPRALGHAGVDRLLACLKQVADGRCVRQMEALLLEHGDALSDVHAWQARHIVQVIRRSGRK